MAERRARGAVVAVLCLWAAAARGEVSEPFERILPFPLGATFRIENVNGTIEIETWDESSVSIRAEKRAPSEEALRDIEIEVTNSESGVSVRTLHHRRREGGHVRYQVRVPVDARVHAETVNGAVAVRDVRGRVAARSVNGGLTIDGVVGEIEATTTNGDIRAGYARVSDGEHRFTSTNGSVRVYLPQDAGGRFEARTLNGTIEVELPATVEGSSRRRMSGSFGSGNARLEIETLNGSIELLPR